MPSFTKRPDRGLVLIDGSTRNWDLGSLRVEPGGNGVQVFYRETNALVYDEPVSFYQRADGSSLASADEAVAYLRWAVGPATEFIVAREQSLPVSTRTSNTFFPKVTMDVDLEPGVYLLRWSYQWSRNNTFNNFEARVQIDGSDLPEQEWLHSQEMQDSGGTFGATGTDNRLTASGERALLELSGPTTITLEWRGLGGGTVSSIWNASLSLYRSH